MYNNMPSFKDMNEGDVVDIWNGRGEGRFGKRLKNGSYILSWENGEDIGPNHIHIYNPGERGNYRWTYEIKCNNNRGDDRPKFIIDLEMTMVELCDEMERNWRTGCPEYFAQFEEPNGAEETAPRGGKKLKSRKSKSHKSKKRKSKGTKRGKRTRHF